MDGVDYRRAKERHRGGPDREEIRDTLRRYRDAGTVFYRDGGDRYGAGLFAKSIAQEYGIDLRTPCFGIHRTGHYGAIVGRGFDSFRDYLALVREVRASGGDFIKIMCSGILDFAKGTLTEEPLSGELIREMIDAAHQEGFAVMAHANGKAALLACAGAGADSVEHGFGMDRECLLALKEEGVVWVPTLAAVCNLSGTGRYPEEIVRKLAEAHKEAAALAYGLGVSVAPGSDAGAFAVPHVRGIRDEYGLIEEALAGSADREQTRLWLEAGAARIRERFRRPET